MKSHIAFIMLILFLVFAGLALKAPFLLVAAGVLALLGILLSEED